LIKFKCKKANLSHPLTHIIPNLNKNNLCNAMPMIFLITNMHSKNPTLIMTKDKAILYNEKNH
jgi:hypothetical protein